MTGTVPIESFVVHPGRTRAYLEGERSGLERTRRGNEPGRVLRPALGAGYDVVVIEGQLLKGVPAVPAFKIVQRHGKTPREKNWKALSRLLLQLDKHPTPAGKGKAKGKNAPFQGQGKIRQETYLNKNNILLRKLSDFPSFWRHFAQFLHSVTDSRPLAGRKGRPRRARGITEKDSGKEAIVPGPRKTARRGRKVRP